MRHRMDDSKHQKQKLAATHSQYIEGVLGQVRERGAFSVADIEDASDRSGAS